MQRQSRTMTFGVRQITTVGMLSAISIILGLTGYGFIPIPPVKATILHVPVIIGAIVEGPVVGAMIGLIFGIFSMIQSIIAPTPLSFAFMNPLVAVLPRILIGITTYYSYAGLRKLFAGKFGSIKIGISAIIGSLTNTIFVLGMIYLIYSNQFAKALNIKISTVAKTIIGIGTANGIPEAIVACAITIPISIALIKIKRRIM